MCWKKNTSSLTPPAATEASEAGQKTRQINASNFETKRPSKKMCASHHANVKHLVDQIVEDHGTAEIVKGEKSIVTVSRV